MKFIAVVIILVIAVFVFLLASAWESFGTRPVAADHERFRSSPQFFSEKNEFDNRRPNLRAEMMKRIRVSDYFKAVFGSVKDQVPSGKLPEVRPDINEFLKPSDRLKVIWFGHSTLLMNVKGKIILLDPVLSGSAAPLSFMVKRWQNPVLELEQLPAIDFVVISHDHYDHLDMQTVKYFTDKPTRFLVPLGVGSHLKGWGLKPEYITELDWWQGVQMDGVEFVATPAQHFSGRNGVHDNQTLWASWVILTENFRLYFSGDSGYDVHFKNIGDKYGPFDVAFLENGQYNEKWREVHILPTEQAQAYEDLRARRLFPIHWGMFTLAPHSWYEPITLLSQIAKERGISLLSPQLGEIVEVNDSYVSKSWWEKLFQ